MSRWTNRKVIVVGGTSGIGRACCLEMAQLGARVVALGRRTEQLRELSQQCPAIHGIAHDVTNFEAIPATFEESCRTLNGLDVVLYAAGCMPVVQPDEYAFDKDREMVLTNYLGAVAWLNLAAERFSAVGHGTIVGIGSVAGVRGRAGQPAYNSSKAALHAYLESLRNRLSRHGVAVTTIKPGPVQTAMTAHLDRPMMSAETAAKKIIQLTDRGGEQYLSLAHWAVFTAIQLVPSLVFRRLNI